MITSPHPQNNRTVFSLSFSPVFLIHYDEFIEIRQLQRQQISEMGFAGGEGTVYEEE